MENELRNKEAYSRKSLHAFLLSALVPGLGHLYNGQHLKAAIYAIGLFALQIGFNLLGLRTYIWVVALLFILLIALRIAIAIDASLIARRTKVYQLKNYNKWYVYLSIVLIWYITYHVGGSISETSRYKPFRVSSEAGIPNLNAGDYVLGDFEYYNTKQPEYGDLIVFTIPNVGREVFRIVGLPNDTLNLENQLVKYTNKKSNATFISNLTWKDYEIEEIIETLPNGFNHSIYRNKIPLDTASATIKNIIVPNNCYFVLGDNRDFSTDGRFLGFVHKQQIEGKLISIYFSTDFSKINKSLDE